MRSSRRRILFSHRAPATGHEVPESIREVTPIALLPMTMASINHALPVWLEKRVTDALALVPGGWEPWAPVDLLAWLHESLGASATRRWDAERNVRVFADTTLAADLVFNTSTHDPTRPMMVVEVVAESLLEEPAVYLKRLQLRSEQLGPGKLVPTYAKARRMVLALTVDQETTDALQAHEFGVVATTLGGCAALWREVGAGG